MNRLLFRFCVGSSLFALCLLTVPGRAQDSASSALFRDPARQLAPKFHYSLNAQPWVVCVGDFNGDGNIDLAIAGITSNGIVISIALGRGDGRFSIAPDLTIASVGYPRGIAAADVNHDGKTDLVVSWGDFGAVGTVNIFLGNGDGTFSAGAAYNAGGGGALVVDYDGDGNPDIVSPQESGNGVDVLLGHGDGTFTSGTSLNLAGAWGNPLAADLNHDGQLDLVFQAVFSGGFYVSLGSGHGTYQPAVFYKLPDSSTGEVIADFNNDGIPDVGFAGDYLFCSFPQHTLIVGVALGNGDGTFQTPLVHKAPDVCGGTLAVAADFNGDGKMDILEISNQKLFLGMGAGVFDSGEYSGGRGGYSLGGVAVDLNGDGAPDLVSFDDLNNRLNVALNVSGDRETLTSSTNPSKAGESVTFTVGVRATVAKQLITGTVTFRDGKLTLGSVTLSNGVATFTTPSLAKGTHRISASYSGDLKYIPKIAKLVQIVGAGKAQ